MYKNRQDNDPPIEKLSTRPRTVRHRSKPTKSLRPARAILTGWKRIVRHTDNRITRVSPVLLRENPVSSSSSSIHLPPLPLCEGRAKRRASRIAAHPSRGRIATTRDDTYTSRSHTQVIVSAVHGCHRRVPTAPLVCYCVAQAVAAAGCRCTLHYLRSE